MKSIKLASISKLINYLSLTQIIMLVIIAILTLTIFIWIGLIMIINFLVLGNVFQTHQSTFPIRILYSIASIYLGVCIGLLIIRVSQIFDQGESSVILKNTEPFISHWENKRPVNTIDEYKNYKYFVWDDYQ